MATMKTKTVQPRKSKPTSASAKSAQSALTAVTVKVKAGRQVQVAYLAKARRFVAERRIHPRRLIPRVPTGVQVLDANPSHALRLEQPVPESTARSLRAASDNVTLLRNVQLDDVATADTASHVCEPSCAVNGNVVFLTGNWFASVLSDGGQTFQFVDPTSAFPNPPGQEFCCDQVVHYVKKIDTFVWLLQYSEDASGNNVERLAFATTAQVGQGQWRIFDISSQGIGFPGLFLDYPDIAVGTNMLYVTMNGFRGNGWERTVIVRIPLAAIKSGNISAQTLTTQENFNFRVAQFCGTTAYWASHNTNSQIRVYKWRESSATATTKDVDVATWEEGNYSSTTPDGRNWLQRADGRMTGATLANGELWFAWTSNKGGANNRPQPFVQIARLKASTLAVLENINVWDPGSGIAFAALSTNSNNEVGVSYLIGGGARFPSHVVGILTGTRREVTTFAGTRGPSDNKWGDYLCVRRAYPQQKIFAATGFTLQGGSGQRDATPNFTTFGRSSDV